MTFTIEPATPIQDRLLIAVAGPQASGKTTSALRMAQGITQKTGGKICLIDTEDNRARKYAKDFKFNHMAFDPPFSPLRYLEAVEAATAQGYGEGDVLIIDSTSHEHEGVGGVLDMHEQFLNSKAGTDWGKRERLKFTAWIKPKADRTRFMNMGLARSRAHIILCFRAKEKIAMVKGRNGKQEVVSAGWQPIGADDYFYQMDITFILPLGAQGRPDWSENAARINEYGEGPLKKALYATQQISEQTGVAMAEWASVPPQPKTVELDASHPDFHEENYLGLLSKITMAYTDEDLATAAGEIKKAGMNENQTLGLQAEYRKQKKQIESV